MKIIKSILRWFFGIIFFFSIFALFSSSPVSAFACLVCVVLLLPPLDRWITSFLLSKGVKQAENTMFKVVVFIVAFVLMVASSPKTTPSSERVEDKTVVEPTVISTPTVEIEKVTSTTTPTSTPKLTTTPKPTVSVAPTLQTQPIFPDRVTAQGIVKANATKEWGDDYSMVKYTIDKQMTVYDWLVKQTKYPGIMAKAYREWKDDYSMVKYEYEKQAKAFESL